MPSHESLPSDTDLDLVVRERELIEAIDLLRRGA